MRFKIDGYYLPSFKLKGRKMKLDEFMVDFFSHETEVLVDADALQEQMRVIKTYELLCRSQQKTIQDLQNKIFGLEARVEMQNLKDMRYIKIDLRG